MIQSKNSSQAIWCDVYTYSKLPASLSQLEELAKNLWWVWNAEAQELFEYLDKEEWRNSQGNPIQVLASLSRMRIDEVAQDSSFVSKLNRVYSQYKEYLHRPGRTDEPSVAYFCMEFGITNILKIYSGGLGILAGDYIKEASDYRVNLVGVGFLYRYGYFDQVITTEGQQVAEYKAQQFQSLPITQLMREDGTPEVLEVPFSDHTVYSHIWRVDVGRVPLYLMDTDIPQNSEWDRQITHQLYGGDWENRMKQEYMLGIGGVMLLDKLGIKQDIYHANEGHAALMNLQRLANLIQREGLDFDHAIELVRASALYTVHTPVPAGHDYFDESLFAKYLSHYAEKLGISFQELIDMGRENPGSHDKFSMSVFALNTCQAANGVSKLHGIVSQEMFSPVWKGFLPEELHVGYVTNGVHSPTWTASEWNEFIAKHISGDIVEHQEEEATWDRIWGVPDGEVWAMRRVMKERLLSYLQQSYSQSLERENSDPSSIVSILDELSPETLLVGFGRRFATYKRAHLLFTDLNRLSEIVNNREYPVRFIFTGKAHPADGGGQGLIKHIVEISRRPEFRGKILFLENYDIRVAQYLIAGVDVWLNTPTRPLEASGTSGMKALMNGVLNFSVLDGWWYEGYTQGGGWALTEKRTYSDQSLQDKLDAATIYKIFENEIIPQYYDRNPETGISAEWIKHIKISMSKILPHFTMRRMMKDYYTKFYRPLAERSAYLQRDNNAIVDQIVNWKARVAQHWSEIEVLESKVVNSSDQQLTSFELGQPLQLRLVIDTHGLDSTLRVDLVICEENPKTKQLKFIEKKPYHLISEEGARKVFEFNSVLDHPGSMKFAIRISPANPLLPHDMDFAYMKWVPLY